MLKVGWFSLECMSEIKSECAQISRCFSFSDNSVQEQPVRELVRKYIRCSSRLTIAQVKKFLKVKLNLKTADQVSV